MASAAVGDLQHALGSTGFMLGVVTLLTALLDSRALAIMIGLRPSMPSKRVLIPRGLVVVNHVVGLSLARATFAVERALAGGADTGDAASSGWLFPARGALSVALIAQFATSTFLGIEFAVVHTLLRADTAEKTVRALLWGRLWSLCVLVTCILYTVIATLVAVRLDTSLLRLVLSSEWLLVLASPLLQAAVLSPLDRATSVADAEESQQAVGPAGGSKAEASPGAKRDAGAADPANAATVASSAADKVLSYVPGWALAACLAVATASSGAAANLWEEPPRHFRDLDLHSLSTHSLPASVFFVALTGAFLVGIAHVWAWLHADCTAKIAHMSEAGPGGKAVAFVAPGFVGTAGDVALYWSPRHRLVEAAKLAMGGVILLLAGPFVLCTVAASTAWEFVDRKTVNVIGLCGKLVDATDKWTGRLMRHPEDGFIAILLVWLGGCLPAWFFYELYLVASNGGQVNWARVALYNIVRIGPMYMHFMHTYVLCHKEGHLNGNFFTARLKNTVPGLKYAFNHWIGMFHGVAPGTFTYSHVYNHHRYDNDTNDVYSTAFRPRNDILAWVRYLPEWFAYACNLSTLVSFYRLNRMSLFNYTLLSTVYYLAFVAAVAYVSPMFCLATLVYAFVEGNVLLSAVNFTWHAFIDVNDPGNDYVNSTTIIEGLNFTGREEYHVVHHQYAGAHRLQHEALYLKHEPEYRKARGSVFYKCNIFEVFGLCISKNYHKLADRYYYKDAADVGMTRDEIAAMLQTRLEAHGPLLASKVGRQ